MRAMALMALLAGLVLEVDCTIPAPAASGDAPATSGDAPAAPATTPAAAPGAAPAAGDLWPLLAARAGAAWLTLEQHTPAFFVTAENVSMTDSRGPYLLRVYAVRDAAAGSGVVAAYVPAASENAEGYKQGATPELNLLVPLPALAPAELPALPRYGWAHLYGAKLVTIPWLDCCNVTGDVSAFAFSPDGQASWTLTQTQAWCPDGSHKGRSATSAHTFTLRYDASVGYCVDVVASIVINAAAAPAMIEFVNFLTPQLANPWPYRAEPPVLAGPRSNLTAWTGDAGASWTGFAENLLAGAMLGRYNVSSPNATGSRLGAVALVAPGGFSAALAFAGPYDFLQETCPTWMDQHQVVRLPPPGPDGYVAAAPTFSLAYLPAAGSNLVASAARLITHVGDGSRGNGSAVMLRLGELEDFSRQPVALTEPLRALVQAQYNPDFAVRAEGGGGRSGPALAVRALTPTASGALYADANALPLVPLNVSTSYAVRAGALAPPDAACPGGGALARIRGLLYEDDDFNTVGDRALVFDSGNATGAAWLNLSVNFSTPSYPLYADMRLEALSATDAAPCNASAVALFDDVFFGRVDGV